MIARLQKEAIKELRGFTSKKLPDIAVYSADFRLQDNVLFTSSLSPLFPLGISNGLIKVLIVGQRKPEKENLTLKTLSLSDFEYITLVRRATSEEYQQQGKDTEVRLKCVQLLELVVAKQENVFLQFKEGRKAFYVK